MLLRICFSILLTLTLSYLLFQVHDNFISGMNPYISMVFGLIPIALIVINLLIIKKVAVRKVKTFLRIIMLLGVLVPIVYLYFKQPEMSNQNPPRRYIDYSQS